MHTLKNTAAALLLLEVEMSAEKLTLWHIKYRLRGMICYSSQHYIHRNITEVSYVCIYILVVLALNFMGQSVHYRCLAFNLWCKYDSVRGCRYKPTVTLTHTSKSAALYSSTGTSSSLIMVHTAVLYCCCCVVAVLFYIESDPPNGHKCCQRMICTTIACGRSLCKQ